MLNRMGLGMGLGMQGRASVARAFNPASIFGAADVGYLYEFDDPTKMWQDAAATTAAVAGQPLGKVLDRSGKGNHLLMADPTRRTTWQQGSGLSWCESDGTNQTLVNSTSSIPLPLNVIIAFRQLAWTSGDRILGSTAANTGELIQFGGTPQVQMLNGTIAGGVSPAVGVDAVITARFRNPTSSLALNNGAYGTSAPGTNSPVPGCTVGGGTGANSNLRTYFVLGIGRDLTDPEIASLRTYAAAKYGGVL